MLISFIYAIAVTTFSIQYNPASWGLDRIDNREEGLDNKFRYPNSAGKGVVVYVLDSGINKNDPEFENRVKFGINFTKEKNGDFKGHGTAVAALIGGKRYGVAKKVTIVDVKVSDRSGDFTEDTLLDALEWVRVDSLKHDKRSIVNLSAGSYDSKYLNDAIKVLYDHDIITVVAAGNDGIEGCGDESVSSKYSISVGSSLLEYVERHGKNIDRRSTTSNWGRCIDIIAPGIDVTSISQSGVQEMKEGTSYAAPLVSGVAAIYMSENIKPEDIRAAIIQSSTQNILVSRRDATPNRLLYLSNSIYQDFYNH